MFASQQAKPVGKERQKTMHFCGCGYPCAIPRPHGPSVEASGDTEVESRSTRKLKYSCDGVLCVARQRLVTKFAKVASGADPGGCFGG